MFFERSMKLGRFFYVLSIRPDKRTKLHICVVNLKLVKTYHKIKKNAGILIVKFRMITLGVIFNPLLNNIYQNVRVG
jgi:hypothetical protein